MPMQLTDATTAVLGALLISADIMEVTHPSREKNANQWDAKLLVLPAAQQHLM